MGENRKNFWTSVPGIAIIALGGAMVAYVLLVPESRERNTGPHFITTVVSAAAIFLGKFLWERFAQGSERYKKKKNNQGPPR
jgi:hypothetical protein